MGTAIVRVRSEDGLTWGVQQDGEVLRLTKPYTHHSEIIRDYFEARAAFDASIGEPVRGPLTYEAPLGQATQIFAQGLNYADHREESGLGEDAPENLIFAKPASAITGPNSDIIRPRDCELLDYEIELGIVMKADVHAPTHIDDQDLAPFIGGLILCNDVSARDHMFGGPMLQWFKGKGHRTFCPAGPILFLPDEADLAQLSSLNLTLTLNGEVKQSASTAQLIHKPAKTINDISSFANLNCGDLILTGTPGGVLAGASLRAGLAVMLNLTNDARRRRKFVAAQLARTRFLAPGDELQLEIRSEDGEIDLGRQTNRIVQG